MTNIERITDLTAATSPPIDGTAHGWETSTASAGNVVIYTYNTGATYSVDSGTTFHQIDANALCQRHGASLFCDQVVMYNPYIERFVWVLMTEAQDLVVAVASIADVESSAGRAWTSWLIPAANFESGDLLFDRPTVGCGEMFTYIAVNLIRDSPPLGISVAIQLHNTELAERVTLHLGYIRAPDVFWLRASQNMGDAGYFAALMNVRAREDGREYISNLRVFEWKQVSPNAMWFDVPIPAVPTEGGTVSVRTGDWLANRRGSLQVLGLTRSGDELWVAWWGNKTITNPPRPTLSFPQPHIEIAVIDVFTRKLKKMLYMWNPDFAFVFPDLATNGLGNVGLSFCWGGPRHDPQFGIGVLTWPTTWPITSHYSITQSPSQQAGGDYITIRRSFTLSGSFCSAGFNVTPPPPAATNRPHYVVFAP